MSRKNRIIVSVVGIFIVLLALIGITYGYFLTRIVGNTNTNSISITTANLRLVYWDGTTQILTKENIIPGTIVSTKDFTVTNEGNSDISEYQVYLENVYNDFSVEGQDDVKLTITCTSELEDGTTGTCNGYDSTYPTANTKLISNSIKVGEVHTYNLIVEYIETHTDQSEDMGKTLQGKVQIYDPNDIVSINGTVSNHDSTYYIELLELNSDGETVDTKTSQIKSNTYTISGITPGTYTLNVKYVEDGETKIKGTKTLTISKGDTESVSSDGTEIVITDDIESITTNINVNDLSILDSELVDKSILLSDKIIQNAKSATGNRTVYSETPITVPLKTRSGIIYSKGTDPTNYYSTTNINQYFVYASDYTVVSNSGEITLLEPQVGLYTEVVSEMKGNYIISVNGYDTLEEANEIINAGATTFDLRKVGEDSTTSTIYYGIVNLTTQSISERTLSETPDMYTETSGKNSYYFRGDVIDNYIEFNNMCWRIVRVQGDGSIKLILSKEDLCSTITESDTTSALINDAAEYCNDYSSGCEQISYEQALSDWYTSSGLSSSENKLKNDKQCNGNDGDTYNYELVYPDPSSDYNYYQYFYAAGYRMYTTKTPSLNYNDGECNNNSYVGMITVDESAFAGASNIGYSSSTYYLNNNATKYYWTSSGEAYSDASGYFHFIISDTISTSNIPNDASGYAVRPVITLKDNTPYTSGTGTIDDPYVVE